MTDIKELAQIIEMAGESDDDWIPKKPKPTRRPRSNPNGMTRKQMEARMKNLEKGREIRKKKLEKRKKKDVESESESDGVSSYDESTESEVETRKRKEKAKPQKKISKRDAKLAEVNKKLDALLQKQETVAPKPRAPVQRPVAGLGIMETARKIRDDLLDF